MADRIDFTKNPDLNFDAKLELPPLHMDLAGKGDFRKEPLSLLSITAEQPRKEVSVPNLEANAKNTSWATDSINKIYQDGVFKVLSNSTGDRQIGLKFLEPSNAEDKRLRLGGAKEKLEDKFGLSVQLQIKF